MTREELIEFGEIWLRMNNRDSTRSNIYEFVYKALKLLKKQPCEDAVSRQAVVQWLENATDDSIEHAIDSNLEFIPPVTPTRKWIPVSEGLPKERETYLISLKGIGELEGIDNELGFGLFIDPDLKNYGWIYFGVDDPSEKEVVAWMPLPKPYKAEMESE